MENQTIKELTSFIKNSPTAFHAVKSIRDILTKEGFQELKESEKWKIEKGGKYYVTRNHSSILAFKGPRLRGGDGRAGALHGLCRHAGAQRP